MKATVSLPSVLLLACVGLAAQNNTAPWIHAPVNVRVPADTPVVGIPFQVGDAEAAADELSVQVLFAPQNLLVTNGVALGGTGADRSLTLYLQPGRYGNGMLQLQVSDPEGLSAEAQVLLLVSQIRHGPVIDAVPDQVMTQGQWPLVLPVTVRDPDLAAGSGYRLTATSSNPAVVPADQSGLSISALLGKTNFLVRIQPSTNTNQTGSSVITLTATDGQATNRTRFGVTLQARQFIPEGPFGQAPATNQVVVADLDGDGRLDLLSAFVISYYQLNLGHGAWQRRDFPAGLRSLRNILPADYDGDGDLDLFAIPTAATAAPALYRNEGGNPLKFVEDAKGTWPVSNVVSAACGDCNGDGRLDLLLSGGIGAGQTVLMLQTAPGVFVPSAPVAASLAGTLAVADFDGDGDLDFALLAAGAGTPNTRITLFANDGSGRFSSVTTLSSADTTSSIDWVDADGDGDWDLSVAQRVSVSSGKKAFQLGLYRQEGGRFTFVPIGPQVPTIAVPSVSSLVPAWGDFDQDGEVDVVSPAAVETLAFPFQHTNQVTYLALLGGGGSGRFDRVSFVSMDNRYTSGTLCVGDWNNDGTLDLAKILGSSVGVLRNQIHQANTPPAAPTGLRAVQTGDLLWLSWGPSHDPNQSAALSYNVRVGVTPGGNQIVPSHALAPGTRLLSTPGNAGFNRWLVLQLPDPMPARLYWSVQAVDNCHAGGLFASEQELHLAGGAGDAPVIAAPSMLVIKEGATAETVLTITDDDTEPAALETVITSPTPAWFDMVSLRQQFPGTRSPSFILTVIVAPGHCGDTTLALTACDLGGHSTTQSIQVEMTARNEPPLLTLPATVVFAPGETLRAVPFSVSDSQTPADQLTVRAANQNPVLFPAGTIEGTGTDTNRFLVLRPAAGVTGVDQIEITVSDPDGGVTRASITVSVETVPEFVLQISRLPSGDLSLTAHGQPGDSAWVLKSMDLMTWERAAAMVFDSAGNAEWEFGIDANEPRAFFRLETSQALAR